MSIIDVFKEHAVQASITAAFSALGSVIAFIIGCIHKFRALERSNLAILDDKITDRYYRYTGRGSITEHGLRSAVKLHNSYLELGGKDDVINKFIEELKDLPINNNYHIECANPPM